MSMRGGSRPDYRLLASQAQQVTDELAKIGSELSRAEFSGTSGDGLVTATVTGNGTLIALDLDRSVIHPDDPAAITERVIDAVNSAMGALTTQTRVRVAPLTESLQDMSARLSERREGNI